MYHSYSMIIAYMEQHSKGIQLLTDTMTWEPSHYHFSGNLWWVGHSCIGTLKPVRNNVVVRDT